MHADQDLMERLAAADPLPDAERFGSEERREADALLARLLATPAEQEANADRVRRPRVRRGVVVGIGAAVSAAAVLAAIDLLDSDSRGPDVVDKAVAAVSRDDVVYHIVERTRQWDVTTGPGAYRREETFHQESWHSPDGRMHSKSFATRSARSGRLDREVAGRLPPRRGGKQFGPALYYDGRENTLRRGSLGRVPNNLGLRVNPYEDPGARLRELERRGRLRLAGTARVGDRPAYRLVSGPLRVGKGSEGRVEFLVDSETYFPLARRERWRVDYFKAEGRPELRGAEHRVRSFTRYPIYERLPLDARSQAQLDLDPHPGATRIDRYGCPRPRPKGIGPRQPCPRPADKDGIRRPP